MSVHGIRVNPTPNGEFELSNLERVGIGTGGVESIPVSGAVFMSGAEQEQLSAVAIINGHELLLPFVNNQ